MFEHSWKEEVGHAQKLIEYGLLRGVQINTPSISVVYIFNSNILNNGLIFLCFFS